MVRSFKGIQTLTGASQPFFGTTMNAASTMQVDPYTGNAGPGSRPSLSVVPVVSASGFMLNDRVIIAPKANFVLKGVRDQGTVLAVDTVANTITVQGLTGIHANGEFVVLNEDVTLVTLIPLSAGNPMYIGNDSTTGIASVAVIAVINQLINRYDSPTAVGNSNKSSEFWVNGTAGDQFTAYMGVV